MLTPAAAAEIIAGWTVHALRPSFVGLLAAEGSTEQGDPAAPGNLIVAGLVLFAIGRVFGYLTRNMHYPTKKEVQDSQSIVLVWRASFLWTKNVSWIGLVVVLLGIVGFLQERG